MFLNNNPDFYPTPEHIITKMLEDIDFYTISTVLEPSAGNGNIAERVNSKISHSYNRYADKKIYDIDCIELDEDLRHILKGKGYRVVHDDFLTYNSFKKYDLIVMNPPFSNGCKHLLKALEIQKNGGKVVCLLNAETIHNNFSNERKDLLRKLEEYNADIEFISNAFTDAERKTDVEIALIKVDIPAQEYNSEIFDELRKEYSYKTETEYNSNDLITSDFIKGIVQQYNFECELGIKLINEFNFMSSKMLRSFENGDNSILQLTFNEYNGKNANINELIKKIRFKYWKALFSNKNFTGLLTSNLHNKYMAMVEKLIEYDFTEYNIYTIKLEMNNNMLQGVEKSIADLFESYSNTYHWYNECSKNIHYYNGWKTNKAYIVNKKVIIPCNIYFGRDYKYEDHKRTDFLCIKGDVQKLIDTEKVFNYLDGGLTDGSDIQTSLNVAAENGQSSKIKCKYFNLTFYKKRYCSY